MVKENKWRPSLRLTISVVLAFVILTTTATLTLLSYHSSSKTLSKFSNDVIEKTSGIVEEQVNSFFREAKTTNKLILNLINSELINVKKLDEVERYFFNFLKTHENVTMLNFGNLAGDYVMVRRQDDGSLSTKLILRDKFPSGKVLWKHREKEAEFLHFNEEWVDDNYDARIRPWFKGALKTGKLHWTDVYIFLYQQESGSDCSRPSQR